MRYSILLFLHLILFSNLLIAQRSPVVFQSDERINAQLNSASVPYGTLEAKVFQLLSPTNRAGQTLNSIQFTFRETIKIEREGRELRLSLAISQLALSGDYLYRGFNVNNYLKPGSLTATADWKDPRGTRTIRSYNIKAAIPAGAQTVWSQVAADSNFNASYKLFVRDYQFYFQSADVRELEAYCKLIDAYYADAQSLQSNLGKLNSSQILDIEEMDKNELLLQQYKSDLSSYKSAGYSSKLPLTTYDPMSYQTNILQFETKLKQLELKNSELKQKLPELYFDKGLGEIRRGNSYSAQQYFERSLKENRDFAPAKVELARIYLKSGNRNQAISLCSEVEKAYGVDYRVKSDNNLVVKSIYDSYLSEIRNEIRYKRYESALRLIEESYNLCRSFYQLSCGSELDNLKREAVQTMFNDEAGKAKMYLNQHNLSSAEKTMVEMEKMLSYYQNLISSIGLDDLWLQLYRIYIVDAKDYNYKANYELALTSLQEAERICRQKNNVPCSSEIHVIRDEANKGLYSQYLKQIESLIYTNNITKAESLLEQTIAFRKRNMLQENPLEAKYELQIKQKSYEIALTEMKVDEQKGQYSSAIQWVERALYIEANYPVQKQANTALNIERIAISWAGQVLDNANKAIARGELVDARKKLSESESILQKYNVPVDKQIYSSLNSAKNNVYSAQCRGFEEHYQSIISEAVALMEKKKFIAADRKFDEAISYANLKNECAIDFADAETYKEEIKAPRVYQQKISEIDELANYQLYDEAITKYVDLEKMYYAEKIGAFGIEYAPIYQFATSQSDKFVIYTIKYSLQQNEPTKGFDLLKVLKNREVKKSQTKTSQILLGVELANKDFKENSLIDPKQKIMQYTFADKWYAYFAKSYVQQWKKLK